MATEKNLHLYPGETLNVAWDRRLCIHVGECGRAEGALFEGGRDPWCKPDLTDTSEVAEVVGRCPTGALSMTDNSGAVVEEPAPPENRLAVSNNGPYYLTGDLDIEGAQADQPGLMRRVALCRCGKSENKPFCDNSHEGAGFVDHGAVGKRGDGLKAASGKLTVSPAKDGPLLVKGQLKIVAASGRVAWTGQRVALCRCGESKNKPFCDGQHKKIGFKSE